MDPRFPDGLNLSFVDGRVEYHRWLAPKRFRHYWQYATDALNEKELEWQADRTSTLR
jgi:prepilin-type processing-associated H-X9-DG protein